MKPSHNTLLIVTILIMTGLAGCPATQLPQINRTALPLPPRPVLPAIKSAELACLSDGTYERIAHRNRLIRQYAEELELIIKSTRETKPWTE